MGTLTNGYGEIHQLKIEIEKLKRDNFDINVRIKKLQDANEMLLKMIHKLGK